MRTMLGALIFGLFLSAASAQTPGTSSNPQKGAGSKCTEHVPTAALAVSDIRGTAQQPLVVNATLPPKKAEEIDQEARDRAQRERGDNRTWWLGLVTACILGLQLVVFAVQAWVFWVQAGRLKQSVDEMKLATEQTKAAAQAAHATVATMKETAQRQLKAYVFIERSRIENIRPGGDPRATINFKNFGQTPAHNVRVEIGIDWAPSFEEVTLKPPLQSETMGSLGPNAGMELYAERDHGLTQEDFAAITDGKLCLFVFGRLSFEDAFENKGRFVNFRLMIGGSHGIRGDNLFACSEGNSTDDSTSASFGASA